MSQAAEQKGYIHAIMGKINYLDSNTPVLRHRGGPVVCYVGSIHVKVALIIYHAARKSSRII